MNTPTPAATPERILQRLDWQVIRRLDGLLQGDYRSLFYGYGVDFADLREYQPQDDIRYIDWNVTARMDTPYVRQYMEDREITGWERPLSLLNRKHEVLAVRVWDPREAELPDIGPVIMEDAETGEQLYVDTHDRNFRTRFAAAAQQREAVLQQSLKHAGVDLLSI